jgi:hypothetical protein
MRAVFVAVIMGWFCFAGLGQPRTGSITGLVSDPSHKPTPDVTVEAKHIETDVFYKAKTSSTGEYTFAQLPAGTYEVSILRPRPFIRRGVTVAPGGSQRLDIQLPLSVDANTLGELGALIAVYAKRPPPPEGPAPRMADGKPDFSGVWIARPSDIVPLVFSPPVELLPWAEALVRERILNDDRDRPSSRCLPNDPVLLSVLGHKYVQTRTLLVHLVVDVVAAHQVFLDGRAHPKDLEPNWLGYSIGKWEGDTLIIDTIGFNDRSWFFNTVPHTEMLHVTERLRRLDLGHLEIETTYDDPGTFTAPVKFTIVNLLAPDEEIGEYVCENNQYNPRTDAK